MHSKRPVLLTCINIEEVVYNIFLIDTNSFVLKKSVYIKEWQGSEVNKWYILIEFPPNACFCLLYILVLISLFIVHVYVMVSNVDQSFLYSFTYKLIKWIGMNLFLFL